MQPIGRLVRVSFAVAAFLASSSVFAVEPPPGSPQREAVLAALRSRVEIDLDTPIGFRVSRIDVSRGWAYVSAVPTRGRQDLDWSTTRFAADFAADMMSNMVLALLTDRGGQWMVVEYALGPTDATWEDWIGRYRLPRALFVPADPSQERDPDTAPIEGLAAAAPTPSAPPPLAAPALVAGAVPGPAAADVADLEKALDDALGATGAASTVPPAPRAPASATPPRPSPPEAVAPPPSAPPVRVTVPDLPWAPQDAAPGPRVTATPPPPPPVAPPDPVADGLAPMPPPGAPVLVENGAGGATRMGTSRPATFTLRAPVRVAQFMTYHYGARRPPGTIALRHESGRTLGPWQANGAVGQGGVAHAYWWVRPDVRLEPGRWTVVDSDPATWSIEASTNGAGIFVLWGDRLR